MSEPQVHGPDLRAGIPAADLPDGALLEGHLAGEPVLLARHGGRVYAVGARCPHYGGRLAEGLVVDGTVRCPWHHAAFDLETGRLERPPAPAGISCWSVEEREGRVRVTGRRTPPPRPRRSRRSGEPASVLILGGGAAGLVAADTLRREGYDGPVAIVESGPYPPYDRPSLSKEYLAGTAPEEWLPLRSPEFYADSRIELVLGRRAASLDAAARQVRFDDGGTRPFDALLIATGAEPVRFPTTAADARVHYLRSLDDCRAIIADAAHAEAAVVLGASFIGLEVAAALRSRGLRVTVVAPEARPLERVLGAELGDMIRDVHEAHGVVFRLGERPAAVGRDGVLLQSGEIVRGDLVVAGIGVRPRSELARDAGLAVNRGIVVNEFLETSMPGIYAAGDVARWPDPRTGDLVRVEHWVVAQRQGQTAARNLLAGAGGDREPFAAVPFFWSAHYDVTIAYAGHAAWWGAVEILGQPAARDAEVRYRAGGRVVAVATVGRDRASLAAEAALETVPAAGCGDRAMTSLQPSATPVVRPLPLAAPSDEFVRLVRRQLTLLGEDPHRAGLARTPERVAASLAWLTRGYSLDVAEVLGDAVFEEAHESMVMVRDIELYSLCEHHMLPFLGRAHIAYIPDGRIVGLSKLPRIVEVFARRLQVQERLTEQIAQAIEDVLRPRGVGVVIEAVHLCMMMRGVEKQNSSTITSALRGVFRECSMTRDEFLRLAHGRR